MNTSPSSFFLQGVLLKCVIFLLSTGDNVIMFPVLDIDQNDIVDTNGAGDAFVGGILLLSTQLSLLFFNNLTF